MYQKGPYYKATKVYNNLPLKIKLRNRIQLK